MRADPIQGEPAPRPRTDAWAEPDPSQLMAELASAGLVSVEVDADGEFSYALTVHGRQVARSMAMSRGAHARVLLGALVAAGGRPN